MLPYSETPTTIMDDCERLYRRLVHNVRGAAPELLSRPFEVSRLYQQLVSYRENRSALGFASVDEYELALLQLLSGARGFLLCDPDLQHAMRAELESPNPDLSAYRAFATAVVRFGDDQLREAMLRHTPESGRAVSAASPRDQALIAARPTQAVDTPPVAPSAPPPAPRPVPVPPQPAASTLPSMPVARPSPVQVKSGQSCRYCAGSLPDGRDVIFCPTCGHNLTVKHCAACNTELEVGWKFCVTCGREGDAG